MNIQRRSEVIGTIEITPLINGNRRVLVILTNRSQIIALIIQSENLTAQPVARENVPLRPVRDRRYNIKPFFGEYNQRAATQMLFNSICTMAELNVPGFSLTNFRLDGM